MMTIMRGKIVWFNARDGFGFIRPEGECPVDVFVHYSKIIAPPGEFKVLHDGDLVSFELFYADRGNGIKKPQAKDVQLITEDVSCDSTIKPI